MQLSHDTLQTMSKSSSKIFDESTTGFLPLVGRQYVPQRDVSIVNWEARNKAKFTEDFSNIDDPNPSHYKKIIPAKAYKVANKVGFQGKLKLPENPPKMYAVANKVMMHGSAPPVTNNNDVFELELRMGKAKNHCFRFPEE